ncbi:MAG: hypothetical protein M3299_00605 [Thermoproteota archaeon]|nr:hypothetical protein [Thermoproteota archaeon]
MYSPRVQGVALSVLVVAYYVMSISIIMITTTLHWRIGSSVISDGKPWSAVNLE